MKFAFLFKQHHGKFIYVIFPKVGTSTILSQICKYCDHGKTLKAGHGAASTMPMTQAIGKWKQGSGVQG